jgi:hypothetical protein
MNVAQLLLECLGMLSLEAHVAPEAPALDLIAAGLEEDLQPDERLLVAHEAGQQQHRMTVAARRGHQHRQRPGQQRSLAQRADLHRGEQRAGRAGVGVAGNH